MIGLVAGDVVATAAGFVGAYWIRVITEARPTRVPPLTDHLPTLAFLVAAVLVTFALMRLYLPRRGATHSDQLGAIFLAVTIANVVAMALSALSLRGLDVPRTLLVLAWVLSILFIWLVRSMGEQMLRAARRGGLDPEHVLIVGAGPDGEAIYRKIQAAPELGYVVAGVLASGPVSDARSTPESIAASATNELPVLGTAADLAEVLSNCPVGEVIVADPSLSHLQILDLVAVCDRARVNVKVFPDLFHLVVREVSASDLGGLPMLRVRDVNLRGWNLLIKRAMDLVLAGVLLVLLSPFMLLVALAVKLTSREGPVFFVQERVGVDGRPFPCVKFRTMRVDAEAHSGPVWAVPNDDRTTVLGSFLRRYSIDELPQLVNVLVGDMSLVGPRPERPFFVQQFSRLIPRYDKRHQEKAGVTGWAQVNGLRGQAPIEERTFYDLFYVEHWSPAFDLKILLKTVAAVIRGRNAY